MDLGLQGRVAVVTAASSGLGLGTARALADEGANLVISARGPERLEQARAELAGRGVEVVAIPADMADPETPRRLVEAAIEHFGVLHVAVANAGGPPPGSAWDVDGAGLEAAFRLNCERSIALAQAARAPMVAAGWGRICAIASVSVVEPIPNLALSNVARTGLWAWVKTAAHELATSEPRPPVTVNLACPGYHATPRMVELGRTGPMGDPDDFGRVVAFLCSAPAGYVNGAAVVVDGGASLAL